MSLRGLANPGGLAGLLRRVYGKGWDLAPAALSGAVALIVVSHLLAIALALLWLLVTGQSLAVTAAVLALLVITFLLNLALAAFLLRGNRLVWIIFVALHGSVLAVTPENPWEVPGYVATVVVLVLLLAPTTVRTVWRRRPSQYAPTYQEMRRPD
jgi:hypothetical protein